ncbi:MAG: hypothetical protein CMI53_00905 [Parcubacteria group bacterium]|jgi:hypothetical protein|nr:hypothetical protein [Parcubacteria group bacterium]
MNNLNNKFPFYSSMVLLLAVIVVISFGFFGGFSGSRHHMMADISFGNMEHNREHFITMKNSMMGEMMTHGDYACCLEKPCTYCLEKTPGHGEGASCHCLVDIVDGRHPCGECIGEILEGHGNPLLAEYFATAITEEVGEQHLKTIQQIISEKYDIAIADQI